MLHSADDAALITHIEGHTAVLRLNRPAVRNAVNAELAQAIEAAWDRVEDDPQVWTAVIAATGSVFCAGLDLNAMSSGGFREVATRRGGFAGIVQRSRTKPLIAAVEGPALAGGCEIVLACDLVVASDTACFGIPEVKRSLIAAGGGLIRLPRLLPRNLAMQMALTGEPISAVRAADLGLVNELVAPGETLARALELAAQINANAPLAVRASRRALLESLDANEHDSWGISWRAAKPLFDTEDFREGPRAFLEKRPPRWTAS